MKNFWQKLNKPFFCLAPMADVTDIAFRKMLAKYSKPDKTKAVKNNIVFWTEFVSADGLCHKIGRKKILKTLKFSRREKPIVVQVFGANPKNMETACRLLSKLGFSGIDINMGCPDKNIIKQGSGSALIKNPELAREIIRSAIAGAPNLPISVKTRVGFNKEEIDFWISELIKEDIKVLTIHARTKKEMSKVPANWSYVKRVVKLVKEKRKDVCVIGNGDIKSLEEAEKKIKETGCDGVMIGRGVFGNPWFFSAGQKKFLNISPEDKLKALAEHIKFFEKDLFKTKVKSFAVMKKHFKAYISGFDGARELREKLMETKGPKESLSIIKEYQKSFK